MKISTICRYCGGVVRLEPARKIYGASTDRLGLANEVLRLKRRETHLVFDGFWKGIGMSRTQAYKWLANRMDLPEKEAHIGGFEMDQCQQVIDLCEKEWKEAA